MRMKLKEEWLKLKRKWVFCGEKGEEKVYGYGYGGELVIVGKEGCLRSGGGGGTETATLVLVLCVIYGRITSVLLSKYLVELILFGFWWENQTPTYPSIH